MHFAKHMGLMLLLACPALAQGNVGVTIGSGPGARTVDIDPTTITGGTVRITTSGGLDITLDSTSAAIQFELPVGGSVTIHSSSGKWWKITNNGSSLSGDSGTRGGGASGPGSDDLDALFENEGW